MLKFERKLALRLLPATVVGQLFATGFADAGDIVNVIPVSTSPILITTMVLTASPTADITIYTGVAAPSVPDDPTTRVISQNGGGAGAVVMPYPLILPPGWGVWITNAGTGGGAVNITYDYLADTGSS